MTAPVSYKTIKVSSRTHAQIHDLANQLGGSADEALAHLLDASTVRVPLSPVQRDRWNRAAQEVGVSVSEFVRTRVESALQFGSDPAALALVYSGVRALCHRAGIPVTAYTPDTPDAATAPGGYTTGRTLS